MRHRHRSGPRGRWKVTLLKLDLEVELTEENPYIDLFEDTDSYTVHYVVPEPPPNLESLSMAELRALAKDRDLDLHGARTKAQIRRRLEGDDGGI